MATKSSRTGFLHDALPSRLPRIAVVVGVLALASAPALAATNTRASVEWARLGMGLFGGLALFLFGMDQMARGLQAAAGEGMKFVLGRLTRNRFLGAVTGALVTAVLNSSSITTVLLVGFVTAGMMTLSQSIGVIMGANIGSTFTAQIIAFNVTQYALALIAIGFGVLFTATRDRIRHFGSMIMGLGLVFYGMGVMGDAMTPLRSYEPFLDLMVRMQNPLLGILVGAVFTGLVQSSAATTGIAIVMAGGGLISLEAGIALTFGANIGTCVTAILAAVGKPVDARRAAAAHILFNVVGVLIWVWFIPDLARLVAAISPAHPDLQGAARMAAEVPRQIANAHTVFNVANTLAFLGFTGLLARLVARMIPDPPVVEKEIVKPRFLDEELIRTPTLALERVRLEIGHMGEITLSMLNLLGSDRGALEEIVKMDDKVDILHEATLRYLGSIRRRPLTDTESDEFLRLMSSGDFVESIADVLATDIVDLMRRALNEKVEPSDAMMSLLLRLEAEVGRSVESAVRAVRDADEVAAQDVLARRPEVTRLIEQVNRHQAARLAVEDARRPAVFRLEMTLVENLKRIHTLSKRLARLSLPVAVTAERAEG